MSIFYFDLVGELIAQDFHGSHWETEQEAKNYADFLARRLGAEKPALIKATNYISVRADGLCEFYRSPLRPAHIHW